MTTDANKETTTINTTTTTTTDATEEGVPMQVCDEALSERPSRYHRRVSPESYNTEQIGRMVRRLTTAIDKMGREVSDIKTKIKTTNDDIGNLTEKVALLKHTTKCLKGDRKGGSGGGGGSRCWWCVKSCCTVSFVVLLLVCILIGFLVVPAVYARGLAAIEPSK